jgi:hypothetical protein
VNVPLPFHFQIKIHDDRDAARSKRNFSFQRSRRQPASI